MSAAPQGRSTTPWRPTHSMRSVPAHGGQRPPPAWHAAAHACSPHGSGAPQRASHGGHSPEWHRAPHGRWPQVRGRPHTRTQSGGAADRRNAHRTYGGRWGEAHMSTHRA